MSPVRTHFVGGSLERWPGLSATGALIRVTRLNRYCPQDYRFALGISVRRQDDLHWLMTFSVKRKEQLASALDASEDARRGWELSEWMPFRSEQVVFENAYEFRYCPECLRFGYHSLMHQVPWLGRCPLHGAQLRTGCHRCGAALRLDGTTGQWLGVCHCGHDHVDEKRAIRGFGLCERVPDRCKDYLAWAHSQRACNRLIAPVPAVRALSVLATEFDLPPSFAGSALSSQDQKAKVHRVCPRPEAPSRSTTEDLLATATKLDHLVDARGAMIEAPGRLAVLIATTACQLAQRLPPGSLSDIEMTLFLQPAGAVASREFVPARRRSILEIRGLPPVQVGERCYLDLHCLSKPALGVAHRIFRWLGFEPGQRLGADRMDDLRVCVSAVGEILSRSYAEGIRVVIGRHVPELYRIGRDRPHLSEPWALIRAQPGAMVQISVVWARQPYSPE
jgi:hypothetical protein